MIKYLPLAIILTVFSLSCRTRQFQVARIIPNKTHINDAILILGPPERYNKKANYYQWKDIGINTKNNIVTAIFKDPNSHEKYLQYWRQLYKNDDLKFDRINTLWELKISKKGISAVYDKKVDRVTRVVLYGSN